MLAQISHIQGVPKKWRDLSLRGIKMRPIGLGSGLNRKHLQSDFLSFKKSLSAISRLILIQHTDTWYTNLLMERRPSLVTMSGSRAVSSQFLREWYRFSIERLKEKTSVTIVSKLALCILSNFRTFNSSRQFFLFRTLTPSSPNFRSLRFSKLSTFTYFHFLPVSSCKYTCSI